MLIVSPELEKYVTRGTFRRAPPPSEAQRAAIPTRVVYASRCRGDGNEAFLLVGDGWGTSSHFVDMNDMFAWLEQNHPAVLVELKSQDEIDFDVVPSDVLKAYLAQQKPLHRAAPLEAHEIGMLWSTDVPYQTYSNVGKPTPPVFAYLEDGMVHIVQLGSRD